MSDVRPIIVVNDDYLDLREAAVTQSSRATSSRCTRNKDNSSANNTKGWGNTEREALSNGLQKLILISNRRSTSNFSAKSKSANTPNTEKQIDNRFRRKLQLPNNNFSSRSELIMDRTSRDLISRKADSQSLTRTGSESDSDWNFEEPPKSDEKSKRIRINEMRQPENNHVKSIVAKFKEARQLDNHKTTTLDKLKNLKGLLIEDKVFEGTDRVSVAKTSKVVEDKTFVEKNCHEIEKIEDSSDSDDNKPSNAFIKSGKSATKDNDRQDHKYTMTEKQLSKEMKKISLDCWRMSKRLQNLGLYDTHYFYHRSQVSLPVYKKTWTLPTYPVKYDELLNRNKNSLCIQVDRQTYRYDTPELYSDSYVDVPAHSLVPFFQTYFTSIVYLIGFMMGVFIVSTVITGMTYYGKLVKPKVVVPSPYVPSVIRVSLEEAMYFMNLLVRGLYHVITIPITSYFKQPSTVEKSNTWTLL